MYQPAAAGDFNSNVPNLIAYSLVDIEAVTEKFSIENKLGQGGYGPVYKVTHFFSQACSLCFVTFYMYIYIYI